MIAIDIETYDPNLLNKGPGVYRRDGKILGVGIAKEDGFRRYFSIGHDDTPGAERTRNRSLVQELLGTDEPKVGANIMYDLDWLVNGEGFTIPGPYHDVQLAEPLLDEYRGGYSLDSLAQQYLGEGKAVDEIGAWVASRALKGDARQYLYLMPSSMVGRYCVADAYKTLDVFKIQRSRLHEQHLMQVYDLESGLIPLLLKMRRIGIRVDEERRVEAVARLNAEKNRLYSILSGEFGPFNFNATRALASILKRLGIEVPSTEKGNESVKNEYLESQAVATKNPLLHNLVQLRKLDKILSTFMEGHFKELQVDGRLHAQFIQLASDEGGTVTGRYSCKSPNLTQIPSRNGNEGAGDFPLGDICRSIFIPEEGCWMGKADLSQAEYRMLAHYAIGPGSDELRQSYIDNPKMDYHSKTAELSGLDRKTAKNLGFGINYGMGVGKMMKQYGWSKEQAYEFRDAYYSGAAFIQPTRDRIELVAKARGYIKTIYGRHERVSQEIREKSKYYVFLNRLMQGSVADLNKKGMLDAYRAGVYDVLYPHLTVHDELVQSVPKTKEGIEAYRELKEIMQNCLTIKVPIVAEAEYGPSYGETEKIEDFESLYKEI